MQPSKRIILFFLILFSINLSAQEELKAKRAQSELSKNEVKTDIVSPVLVYHNNNPSDASLRDFTWSLEGYSSEADVKQIISKLQLNTYFKNISILESGEESKVFIKLTLTEKYDETKVVEAFYNAGVLLKRTLDEESVTEIKK